MLVKIIMAPIHGASAPCQVFCMHLHNLFSGPGGFLDWHIFHEEGCLCLGFEQGGCVWTPWRRTLPGSCLDTS